MVYLRFFSYAFFLLLVHIHFCNFNFNREHGKSRRYACFFIALNVKPETVDILFVDWKFCTARKYTVLKFLVQWSCLANERVSLLN